MSKTTVLNVDLLQCSLCILWLPRSHKIPWSRDELGPRFVTYICVYREK